MPKRLNTPHLLVPNQVMMLGYLMKAIIMIDEVRPGYLPVPAAAAECLLLAA
jgi:hypothetical protein